VRRLPWLVPAALAALAAGCGQPAQLDVDRAEASIRTQLAGAWDVPVRSVTCPDDIDVEQGARTTCRATISAGTVDVVVRQTDDEGALAVAPSRAVLVTARVADDVEAVLADRFDRDDATVSCPGAAVRIVEPDDTFTCEAVDGDERKDVVVRVRDARGALTYALEAG
jgi:hypothetical protein